VRLGECLTAVKAHLQKGHVIIENVDPRVDCGRYRAKSIVSEPVEVVADIYRDGPDLLSAILRYRGSKDKKWREAPMRLADNDRYVGSFVPDAIGYWRFTVEAWTDRFGTWRRYLVKRVEANQDIDLELEEGARLIDAHLKTVPLTDRSALSRAASAMREPAPVPGSSDFDDIRVRAALDERVRTLMARYHSRKGSTTYKPNAELEVDRKRARFGSWYEFFPRSTGDAGEHGSLRTAAKRLPEIAEMGFDVVYLPPIHPIGDTHRKGKNNTLSSGADDVGVPWAIGNTTGGHKAIHPELGTIEDFDDFVEEAQRHELEVCLDFAIQCSPDHPWVEKHPEWFHHRPDGSIKYAENPPKKYQDIYPINFDTEDREGLWLELKSVLDFWIEHGVKIFRVDNPHTKALPFWEWVIEDLYSRNPDLILLAEAFTRPAVMKGLAKLGFQQSYTYFTWRNDKHDLTEYMRDLTRTDMAKYFRPNFFANTPDILHEYLQTGGRPSFKVRLVLAALLSPSFGIYSGYELFENTPVHPGSEEYLHSEKYELRPRDFRQPDSLVPYLTKINQIRRAYPVLHHLTNLEFHYIDKDSLIAFSKSLPGETPILAVVNLNPFHWEEGTLHIELDSLGIEPWAPFKVHDLITNETYEWQGSHQYIRLDPFHEPAHIFQVTR
jgi:starch synthase (maltosyl-transferring)